MGDRSNLKPRPRNKHLHETLMSKKAASGSHKPTEEKRERSRLQKEIDKMLEEDRRY